MPCFVRCSDTSWHNPGPDPPWGLTGRGSRIGRCCIQPRFLSPASLDDVVELATHRRMLNRSSIPTTGPTVPYELRAHIHGR